MSSEVFGSLAWSPSGAKFIYVAEKKSPEDLKDFSKFIEKENFGERLQNVKEPIFCLFDAKFMKIDVIESVLDSCFIAQPAFIDDESIALRGIHVGAKKLG